MGDPTQGHLSQLPDINSDSCSPMVALKLDVAIHWLPCWVVKLRDIWDGGPLVFRQRLWAIEQPDEAALHGFNLSASPLSAQNDIDTVLHCF